jgi:hypothetical protein
MTLGSVDSISAAPPASGDEPSLRQTRADSRWRSVRASALALGVALKVDLPPAAAAEAATATGAPLCADAPVGGNARANVADSKAPSLLTNQPAPTAIDAES